MSAVIVIPARYASSRFPGKPLQALTGATGVSKSLVQRSWEAGKSVKGVDRVVVATDDDRIEEACTAFGAEVVRTSSGCRNGTERAAEAISVLGISPEIVINLQGDAPLTPHWFVEDMISAMQSDASITMATPVLKTDADALEGFRTDRRNNRVGGTTAVFSNEGKALYFSKEVLPFSDKTYGPDDETPVFHHVGLYAFRPDALAAYLTWPEGRLEKLEGLEQLRFLENGWPVNCVEVEARGHVFWELNNPVDVARVESAFAKLGIE